MLSRIFIQNFALIDVLEIHLNQGLQVITGETGAGKSIILGALRLLMGERADAKSIQNSEAKSIVEGEFILNETLQDFFEDHNLDFEEQTIIRREILPNGKSRAFVNDIPTTLEVLKKLSSQIIDIHSQFETANLFTEKFQFEMIDGLCQNKTIISDYQEGYRKLLVVRKEFADLKKQLDEGNKESDYQNFLLDELLQIDLDHCNLEEMQSQLSMHENAEQIAENLKAIFIRTDQDEVGVIDALLDIKNKLSKTAELSHQFGENQARMEAIFVDFKDLVFDLQNRAEKIDLRPEILIQLHEKINSIHQLLQKHRVNSVNELIEIRTKIQTEQSNFDGIQEQISEKEKMIESQENNLLVFCNTLSENRKKAIPILCEKMESLLQKLGLDKAKIAVKLLPLKEFGLLGKESIQLLFQANSGFELNPIQNAISGGERSRVMLAVKKIMAENTELPTLILDEIDTGVSGKVADEMGKLMQVMASDLQLIVISHLAQVAAKGNNNYKVVKNDNNGKAQTTIIELSQAEKLQEIAQLLSGATITPAALQQAEE